MTQVDEVGANLAILRFLRSRAEPYKRERRGMDYGGWELHTHPDLIEQFEKVAGSPEKVVPLLGVAAIVHEDAVVAVAMGTEHVMVRLPEAPQGVKMAEAIEGLSGHGWHAVSAWQPDEAGFERLKAIVREARDNVHSGR